ncbi:hypothetical protein CAP35_15075 [Chitinophagaceae bacterium IBVUCB1]|nr:hypothetical protein CAP35_15075 [Chitinophagaceae bacterium IBVUCB1]
MDKLTKTPILIAVAVIFHLIGFVGIGILHNEMVSSLTPFHLLLMFALLLLSYKDDFRNFIGWVGIAYLYGLGMEAAGVNTGLLFGRYSYGDALGIKAAGVPLLIGVNWVLVVAGAYAIACKINTKPLINSALTAAIATGYDWVLEPVAVKLNYWQWEGGVIPVYNYVCWFGVSMLIGSYANKAQIIPNKFSLWLFIIQLLFFILLRIVL